MLKRLFAIAGLLTVFSAGSWAAAPRVAVGALQAPDSAAQALERAIEQEISRRGGVGATVAAVANGRVLLARSFGRRSTDSPAPVGEDTLFGVGSVTKQFTAAATLLLAEDGKLSVDDKVAKYYPGLTRANEISLLDLMNHVSATPITTRLISSTAACWHRSRQTR